MTPALLDVRAVDGLARVGVVTVPRGQFETPCFMPVGTRGAVRLLDSADLEAIGPQVVLANAYHLMLRPGAEAIDALGGLHRFMGWNGLLLTDSGGYQVFSLSPRVDDEGVTFRSTYDGSAHRLTPVDAVKVQEMIGADIQMVLDICCRLPASDEEVRLATKRTLAWAARAREAHTLAGQCLFGIVQGGVSADLRAEAAAETVAMDFDGYAIGGLSVGESREQMLAALAATVAELPSDRPRYLMGVGDPISMVDAIALGVDMFDCVLPTRLARHGTALRWSGRLQVRSARFATDAAPVDPDCACPVCTRYSVGYLRHLLLVNEPAGGRLLTLHNISWVMGLFERIRGSVRAGAIAELRSSLAAGWERGVLR